LPAIGLLGWGANRSVKRYGIDTMSGATIQINQTLLSELKGELPKGKIGNQELSRLVMGGNLIGGWAHARDLIYAEKLFKAYNSEKKIFETLMICEQAGINCINIGYPTWETMVKYRKVTGSKIKIIIQVSINEKANDIYQDIKESIDNGMDVIQMQGNWVDRLVRDKRIEVIDKFINRVRSNGFVAGLGAHNIYSLIECEENGIIPDYYMTTFHHDNYWSAHPREYRTPFEVIGGYSSDRNHYHDNCFCTYPDESVEFVNRVKIPVMGYKVLAAGSIHPKNGFRWALENGADFICVGMFDFQVVEDVNICTDILGNLKNRKRAWYA
jgi:phosphoheptose isomerase